MPFTTDSSNETTAADPAHPSRTRRSQVESRMIWETAMGHASKPVRYSKTSALLLGWQPKDDDTGVSAELTALESVLKEEYGFHVWPRLLDLETDPQHQAFRHLSEFVHAEDSPDTLLIVYYAGHGWSEANDNGEIRLSGRLPGDDEKPENMSLEWIEVERTLSRTRSDVLVIFDCCHAGLLCRKAWRGIGRCYQYIGACEAGQRTRSAGPSSFTTAMIWALKQLANTKKKGFPVTELVNMVMKHETFPRGQLPVLFGGRFEAASENIYIVPAPNPSPGKESVSSEPTGRLRSQTISPHLDPVDTKKTADYLDLRFHFETRATGSDIQDTAKALKGLLQRQDLNCHRVSFIDHCSPAEWAAAKWIGQWRRKSSLLTPQVLAASRVLDISSELDEPRSLRLQTHLLPPTPESMTAATSPTTFPLQHVQLAEHSQQVAVLLVDDLLASIHKVVEILFRSRFYVPTWHQTPFIV